MKLIQHVWMACIGLCLFSCTQTDELETAQGKTGFIVSLTDGTKLDVSRATPGDIVDSEGIEGADFNLRIVNAETEGEIYNDKVGTEVIKAYSGVYDLTATYGENPVLALDAPYFKGETTGVEVFNNKTTPVTIACKVANALVSVTYDNSKALFEDVYSNYYVEVKVGEESVEIKDVAQSAYMQAGSAFEVIFHGTPKDANEDKSVVLDTEFGVPATLNAGDHLKLTLSPKLDRFDIPLNIESVAVETAPLTEEIPMEWLPKPKVEAEGFTNNELSFVETEQKDAKLKLTLSSALQDIKFKFNFEDEQDRFASLDKENEYFLSTDKEVIEQALGITLPAVGEKPESIDLSGLIAKLQTNAGEPTTNTIEIDVQANDRWSSEDAEANRVYTLTCNKPEFSIAVQEGNVWTKTFTIDEPTVTAGNAEVLKEKLVYQYKEKDAGDNAWETCSNGLEQVFSEAPANKSYQVRAFYREGIVSNVVDITLETPAQLPNSDMEEWHYSTYSSGHNPDMAEYYPWNSGESSYWNTNNNYTTRYRERTFAYPYNSFPAVSYVPGRNGGKAAELRNTGSGAGNTTDSWFTDDKVDDRNRVAGILFTGDFYCETGNTEFGYSFEKTDGRDFDARPTSLVFWYKYLPYNSDTWKVHIELWDEDKNVIIQQSFQSSEKKDEYEKVEVKLNYEDNAAYNKCKYIYVIFQSTITEGANMPFEWYKSTYVLWRDNEQVSYEEPHIGSILTIDDISLIYDK